MILLEEKLKATDYVTESLKLIVGVSMPLVGGLVAYGVNSEVDSFRVFFVSGFVLLLTSAILAVININSLINKLHSGNLDAIKERSVRWLNFFTISSFILGVGSGLIFIWNTPFGSSNDNKVLDNIVLSSSGRVDVSLENFGFFCYSVSDDGLVEILYSRDE